MNIIGIGETNKKLNVRVSGQNQKHTKKHVDKLKIVKHIYSKEAR